MIGDLMDSDSAHTTSNSDNEMPPIEVRVQRSLSRIGLNDVVASHSGGGNIMLTGRVDAVNDRVIAVAVARSVAGVENVKADIQN